MNDLTTNPTTINLQNISMSSREIADLTGKQHKHVLRDIDVLVSDLGPELGSGIKSSTYLSGDPLRGYRQYELDYESTLCLVAGYNVTLRMKIIKRWRELEVSETRHVAEMNQAVQKVIDSLPAMTKKFVEDAITRDPRVAAVSMQSAKEVCDQLKVPSKGRGRLVQAVAHKLNAYCVENQEMVAKCPRSQVRLFPLRVTSAWIRDEGKDWVAQYLAKAKGDPSQTVIPFPNVRREIEQ